MSIPLKRFAARILLFVAALTVSCSPTYDMLDGDRLHDFWVMSHPLYESFPLRILMPEGQYAFIGNVELTYKGMECFVSGKARHDGDPGERLVKLPMWDAKRVWLDMYLLVHFRDGEERELRPGYWYFSMERGVPQLLVEQRIDPDATAGNAIVEERIRYNDVSAVGWRSGYYSPLLDYAVQKGVEEALGD